MPKRKQFLLTAVLFACIAGCAALSTGARERGEKIRVQVWKGGKELNVKGSKLGPSVDIKKTAYGRSVVNGKEAALPLRFSPDGGLIYVNDRPFRGTIDVMEFRGGLMAVNELYLETYLAGLINNEISSRWPADAVKAQAVIARTYALYQRNRRAKEPFHIEGSVIGQVYTGAFAEDEAAFRAVRETRGEVLMYDGEPALTVYHSNAGGATEASSEVWSRDYPYLVSVKSPYDEQGAQFSWEFALGVGSLKELLNAAGHGIDLPEEIYVASATPAGRAKVVVIRDRDKTELKLSAEELRKAVGYGAVRSAFFTVTKSGELFIFKGRGSGHGVGLSQWGAKGMAEAGYNYKEILKYYYPGTGLVKAY